MCFVLCLCCFVFVSPPTPRIYARRWRGHISLPGRRLGSAEGQMLPTRRQLLSASLRSLPRTYVGCQGAAAVTGCSSSRGELMRADGAGCDRLIGRELRGPRPLRLEDVFFSLARIPGDRSNPFELLLFLWTGGSDVTTEARKQKINKCLQNTQFS